MGSELELTGGMAVGGGELATAGAAAAAQHEIQSAIIIARKFPRNEKACFQKLMLAAMRTSFAEDAMYSFPRGDKNVTGPSVNLAREAARLWGNIRFGLYVVRDDEETRLIRGFAYDVESNVKVEVEDDFKKLIQRKVKGGKPGETVWLVPDERDLRELTNRRGAILLRNALLQVMPKDLIEDALFQCSKTLETQASSNPEGERKRLLVDFGSLNISVESIEKKLGHAFDQSSPKELAELRGVCKSIMDSHTTWAEYTREVEPKEPVTDANKEALKAGLDKMQQTRMEQDKPADPPKQKEELTMAMARAALRDTTSGAEVGAIVAWSFDANLTPAERAEIQKLKDEACSRMAKAAQESKKKR